jgi:hypothetical protein
MTKLTVTKVLKDTLVIRQYDGKDCFIATVDSIVISIGSLANILQFLVLNEYMSPKVLEGILEEYNSTRKELNV